MRIKLDLTGLKRLQRNARAFSGTHQVPLTTLFNSSFMRSNTRFSSIESMVEESGIQDFANASDQAKDDMVRKLTKFPNWQEFLNAASVEYTKEQLFK